MQRKITEKGHMEMTEKQELREKCAERKWNRCEEIMPPNAEHMGEFCPRYLVSTKFGVTEGWYNPDRGVWYILLWKIDDVIDLETGYNPELCAVNPEYVDAWQELPKAFTSVV